MNDTNDTNALTCSRKTDSGMMLCPVLIDLSDQTVLVIAGSGSEEALAMKYLPTLSLCTRDLRVLSFGASQPVRDLTSQLGVCLTEKEYEREDLYGADFVLCTAADAAVTDDVYAACRTLGIRLQITSQPRRSDYLLQTFSVQETEDS